LFLGQFGNFRTSAQPSQVPSFRIRPA
jgi:hypothetical protein